MKITVCGKGGCGKSTVTTLLAKELARMGKKVLVVDSDESNFGLHRQLGVELPRDFTEYFGGKDKAFKTMMTSGILDSMKLSAFAKKFFSEDFTSSTLFSYICTTSSKRALSAVSRRRISSRSKKRAMMMSTGGTTIAKSKRPN